MNDKFKCSWDDFKKVLETTDIIKKEKLLREWRIGDNCRVMGSPAKIVLKDKGGYHVKYWGDGDTEFSHRIFEEHELEEL